MDTNLLQDLQCSRVLGQFGSRLSLGDFIGVLVPFFQTSKFIGKIGPISISSVLTPSSCVVPDDHRAIQCRTRMHKNTVNTTNDVAKSPHSRARILLFSSSCARKTKPMIADAKLVIAKIIPNDPRPN